MRVSELEPKRVMEIFEELSGVPHGSGNTALIADYCMSFAKKLGLRAVKDSGGNVMIFKDGSAGYENSEPVILQGHMDMVCEKRPDCGIDMENEGLRLATDGEYVWAEGTTLGGDDGIAVAYILAVLASDDIEHPPIEALITNDEEIGLRGAKELEAQFLKGRRLINMDSEDEGILTVSCAGGVRANCFIPMAMAKNSFNSALEITVGGLAGGHSGIDINNNRRNGIIVLARVLNRLGIEFSVSELEGGGRDNVIPKSARAVICLDRENAERVRNMAAEAEAEFKIECASVEPEVFVSVKETAVPESCISAENTKKLVFTILNAPNGVISMNPDMEGMVRTSLNTGAATLKNDGLRLCFLLRSSVGSEKQALMERLENYISFIGGSVEFVDDYPGWAYTPESELRELMSEVFSEMYGREPVIEAIHAGLECGILSEKLGGADMVSFGPDLENVHTPDERMSVASVKRCWEYLIRVLGRLK